MENALRVQILHAGGDVFGDGHPRDLRQVYAPVLYQLVQGSPVDVLGEGVQLPLVHAHPHQPQDVGVGQPVHQLDLFQHVAPVGAQLVHLQDHHLARAAMGYLEAKEMDTISHFCQVGVLIQLH